MRSAVSSILVLAAVSSCAPMTLDYPDARIVPHVDEYHGTEVADPYRWLEESDSPDTRAWIDAENRLTDRYLETIPDRGPIRARLASLWNHDRYSLPVKESGRYFWFKHEGLKNQPVLWWADGDDGEPRALIDANTLSEDGTTSVPTFSVTRDSRMCAYQISEGGLDWRTIRVRDVDTGKDLADEVRYAKFTGIAWAADGSGFYYSRYDAPVEGSEKKTQNEYHKLYFHALGTPQARDALVYERSDHPGWAFSADITLDGRYLVIGVWDGTSRKNGLFYRDLEGSAEIVELRNEFEAGWDFVHNDGSIFYFVTDLDAPRGRLVALDTKDPERRVREIIAQSNATLQFVSAAGGKFVAGYLEDAKSEVKIYSPTGVFEKRLELPATGSVSSLRGRADQRDLFYSFTSFTYPTTILRYDVESGEQATLRAPEIEFDPSEFESKQVFFTSKDGTHVPMFIVHRRGIRLDGRNPTYLYGYGGFNNSLTPAFSVPNVVWLEIGGVYAMPNLRGGGEYGESWHEAGTKANKQNVFDDFIAAAEWLIKEGYTSPDKLAIGGRSNGGLLVGACITQRPELYAAALPGVGVLDMLRFNKFTIGKAWESDYGSPENPDEFPALYAYSPYHNVRDGLSYPSTLVTTADHDDRVVPLHSYKFTAMLQAAQQGARPILISIDTKAGHGAGKPTEKLISEWADNWGFLAHELDFDLPPDFD